MKFIRLLLAEAGPYQWRLIASVTVAGGAMALMMTIVNSVADLKPGAAIDWTLFVLFALCALAVISLLVYSLNLTAVLSERMLERIRIRIADLVRRSELDGIERIGPVRVYDTIARETMTVSESRQAARARGQPEAALSATPRCSGYFRTAARRRYRILSRISRSG